MSIESNERDLFKTWCAKNKVAYSDKTPSGNDTVVFKLWLGRAELALTSESAKLKRTD